MKGWLPMALGLLAVVLGAVWTLQGLDVLDGSVMSGVSSGDHRARSWPPSAWC